MSAERQVWLTGCLTKHIPILGPQNLRVEGLYVVEKRRSNRFGGSKYANCSVGWVAIN